MTIDRPPSVMRQRRQGTRRDPNSLVASAAVMTGRNPSAVKLDTAGWQAEAWGYYDTVGELRFGVNWLANALSRVNLVAAVPPRTQGDEPTPIDVEMADAAQRRAVELVSEMAGGVAGQGQMLASAARQLTVPGVGYIYAKADEITDAFTLWRVLSNDEVRRTTGVIEVRHHETGAHTPIGPNDLLVKLWRSHPRFAWVPDSPVRAVLSSLLEIQLICSRIVADATSRLAGNGLLVLPTEAVFAASQSPTDPDSPDAEADDFVETFMEVMQVPIRDRTSPAAVVPLIVKVPGEFAEAVRHITFWSEFDTNLEPLRQSAVKRLALGLDMPPEVLLGMGDSNHWSAWQIAEEAITLHIEPLAETVCHAFTVGFLQPALEAEGFPKSVAMVWYDTSDLTTRPDRSASAGEAHARGKLTDEAYLRELGLDASDLPDAVAAKRAALLAVATGAPSLAPAMLAVAGVITMEEADTINRLVAAAAGGEVAGPAAPVADAAPADRALPERQDEPPAGEAAAVAGLVAGADGLVVRAMERAGARLRAAVGKGKAGGSAAVECADPMTFHTVVSATEYASLDHLLAGAWDRAGLVAARAQVDPASFAACLDGYCRGLLAAGHAHDFDLLAATLGARDVRLAPVS